MKCTLCHVQISPLFNNGIFFLFHCASVHNNKSFHRLLQPSSKIPQALLSMILFLVYIILLCKSPHGYDHWKCVLFFDWQISLSVMTFSPISGVTNGLFSMSKTPPCMDVYSLSFISSLVDWYLGYFYFSVIMNFASTFLLL